MQKDNKEEKIGTEASVTELSDEMLDDVTGGNLTQGYRELRSAKQMKGAAQMKSGANQMKNDASLMKD